MKKSFLIISEIILAVFTLIYPFFMVMLSGAGLIFNGNSYGIKLMICGILWIISGLLMTSGSILCIFGKNIPAVILSSLGFVICMVILFIVTAHAEKYAWSMPYYNKFSVADIYRERIVPVFIPFMLANIISGLRLCRK